MKGWERNHVTEKPRQQKSLEEQDRGLPGVPEEDEQIEAAVRLSGLTKQDYITRRLLCRDVVVQGNPKVYKALRDQLAAVLDETAAGRGRGWRGR